MTRESAARAAARRPAWRQKWRRVPPERRAAAAAALPALFERGKHPLTLLVAGALLLSVIVHAATVPFLVRLGAGARGAIAAGEGDYLKRVMQKDRAKQKSKEVKGRITMPPPPPDPEAVVNATLADELTSDVEKVVGNLLEANVTENLTDYVKANLKDELAHAARDIADGQLSEAEIKQLQEEMKRKAHELTVQALKQHRIKTQVKRAQISVTEWYKKDVSRNLMKNIYHTTFLLPHKGAVWQAVYAGKYFGQKGKCYNWSQARSLHHLRRMRGALARIAQGLPARGYSRKAVSTWPTPGAELARRLDAELRGVHTSDPSWRALVQGGMDTHRRGNKTWYQHQTDGLLNEFYPHRRAEMAKAVAKVSALWTAALAASSAYVQAADADASAPALKAKHDALIGAVKAVERALGGLHRVDEGDFRAVNSIVRSRVLRGPERERVYKRLVDRLVGRLGPMIQDFAVGQFEEGIIKWDKSAEAAMVEFPKMVLPLLRRDVMRLFPKKRFDKLIFHGDYADRTYRSPVTGERRNWPTDKDVARDEAEYKRLAAKRPELRAYAEQRRGILTRHFERSVDRVADQILARVLSQGLMFRNLAAFVEGVDFADEVQEKLDARKRALQGRGQDLAKLTKDGVPDTSASQFALLWGGAKGHGANLIPTQMGMRPGLFGAVQPETALLGSPPRFPPPAATWGLDRQVEAKSVRPSFAVPTPRFEAIPFLAQFPRLDGRVGDLAKIRPLVLRPPGGGEPILFYAAWNYQGFFFCYQVKQAPDRFYWPVPSQMTFSGHGDVISHRKATGVSWAFRGDSCRLMFDTLDARNKNRGEPHTQEFVVFPRGTDTNPYMPGIERVIASQRDAVTKEYRGVKSSCKRFPSQPMEGQPPDGTGPHRVTRMTDEGYTVEIFLPRSAFNFPVFAPGWYIGFDCAVAQGAQPRNRLRGQTWAGARADQPDRWGDLLLLGTDPRVLVQRARLGFPVAEDVVPGHSYLLTVVDPDRNVYLNAPDTVLVSAETRGETNDVEVFILKETKDNSGVFRGYIDTQPGRGREMHGVLEVMPGDEIRFGYVDTANSHGRRNVIYQVKLSVVAGVTQVVRKGLGSR